MTRTAGKLSQFIEVCITIISRVTGIFKIQCILDKHLFERILELLVYQRKGATCVNEDQNSTALNHDLNKVPWPS